MSSYKKTEQKYIHDVYIKKEALKMSIKGSLAWRYLSWRAPELSEMTSLAIFRAWLAFCSPWAAITWSIVRTLIRTIIRTMLRTMIRTFIRAMISTMIRTMICSTDLSSGLSSSLCLCSHDSL